MKYRIYLIAALISASAIITSCAEGEFGQNMVPQGDAIISASVEAPVDSRTSLSNGGAVLWSDGDSFALFAGQDKLRYTIFEGAGSGSGRFAGPAVTQAGECYAFYPYSEGCAVSDGALMFSLPQHQSYTASSFASGASPAIATLSNAADDANFKNICGVLSLSFKFSSGFASTDKIARIAVIDLAGQPLWGECSLSLDGKQGTAEQKLEITGGSNVLYLDLESPLNIQSSYKSFNLVVPAGAFSKGFSVVAYDASGKAISFLTSQHPEVCIARSTITQMNNTDMPSNGEPLAELARGYYKEVFMNGGVSLTSRTTLPAAPFLGWELEYLATSSQSVQDKVIIGDENDSNGALLYPDGEPRYRMIYCNGGQSNNHGKSLGETGRSRLIQFVTNGGSWVGTCAGALIASMGYDSYAETAEYLHIWPGHVYHTGLSNTQTDMTVMSGAPLLNYYTFGDDLYIKDVRHNGGCYMDETNYPVPEGTEVLMRYECPGKKPHGKPSCWAYKPNEFEGRRVLTGSHPEAIEEGERREMMAAMMRYATDGGGVATAKAELVNGEARVMDNNADPLHAKIGDGQYHHFKLIIPQDSENVTIELSSAYSGNLQLALRKGGLAWRSDADFILAQKGAGKTLSLDKLTKGEWYVSVYCPDKPTSTRTSAGATDEYYYSYSGNVEPLEGVAYTIKASWTDKSPAIPGTGTEDYPVVVM